MSLEDSLHVAVITGDELLVKTLLECGVNVNARDKNGNAPLHLAILYYKLEMLKILYIYKARVNDRNNLRYTPLHIAAIKNYLHIHTIVADKNLCIKEYSVAEFLLGICCANPKVKDKSGNFPIHLAAQYGNLDALRALVEISQDFLHKENNYGFTPLHLAVMSGCEDMVRELINYNFTCYVNTKNKKGDSALIMASRGNHASIVKLLLANGADFNQPNNAGQTFGDVASVLEIQEMARERIRVLEMNPFKSSRGLSNINMPKPLVPQYGKSSDVSSPKLSSSGPSASRSSTSQYADIYLENESVTSSGYLTNSNCTEPIDNSCAQSSTLFQYQILSLSNLNLSQSLQSYQKKGSISLTGA